MFSATAFQITAATAENTDDVRALAERNSQDPITGRTLVGWIDGVASAAISVDDGRVVADSSDRADQLAAHLRMRAAAARAYEATPSLSERMLAGLPARYRIGVVPAPKPTAADEYAPAAIAA